jgi:hypothetical protein
MPPISQLIVAMLSIFLITIIVLGIFGLFLPDKTGRGHWVRRGTRQSTHFTSAIRQDFPPLNDSPWPELYFEMDAGNARFNGAVMSITALIIGLLFGYMMRQENSYAVWDPLLFAILIGVLGYGFITFLSSLPRWQSCIVLEAERLVIYPTFGRPPRVVNYDQICYVGTQTHGIAVLIRYYPFDYGGQVDVTRMCQMGLPSTSQNEGLRLVLQARIAGPPIDHTLELALLSKWMAKRFALFPILFGIALLAIALQPESRGRVLLVPLGLLEIGLLCIVIVMGWPVRRK